jgi:hypothetical protein
MNKNKKSLINLLTGKKKCINIFLNQVQLSAFVNLKSEVF